MSTLIMMIAAIYGWEWMKKRQDGLKKEFATRKTNFLAKEGPTLRIVAILAAGLLLGKYL